jgi:hypothetical protein
MTCILNKGIKTSGGSPTRITDFEKRDHIPIFKIKNVHTTTLFIPLIANPFSGGNLGQY